jgi:putative ABC transport system permease protein
MSNAVISLSLPQLALAFVPVVITLAILVKWSMSAGNALYALARMLVQLLLIGYVLAWIFGAESGWLILIVLAIMILASSWIALRTVPEYRWKLLGASFASIALAGGFTLLVISQAVLQLEPWYLPRYLIPLAGMVFANSMTAVSLAAERL